ncbi:MAG TPA: dual specificity protein phosphatase family protein [Bryobacteraceae bacterium]|nr:dual specificity protein phosphatase family protein [Bryobacteraceae bacterium]
MWTKLYWIDGPWPGKLALAARPRGGEWLDDEIESWRREGIGTVFSLLTPEEAHDLDLGAEASTARAHGMKYRSFPILDRRVPDSESGLSQALKKLDAELEAGRNVVLHCRQGVGRSGLVAACLLVMNGIDPKAAVQRLSAARGAPVPETPEQRRWIDQYAKTYSAAHHHG